MGAHDLRRARTWRRAAGVIGVVLVAGCSTPDTSTPDTSSTVPASGVPIITGDAGSSVASSAASASGVSASGVSASGVSASATPVTEPGMLTGPGVDDTSITLGTLVDPATDRGFLQGLDLWQTSVNASGGVCGRTVVLESSGVDDVPSSLPAAYRALGGAVVGFVTGTESSEVGTELASMLSADQIPALTVTGTASDLLFRSPVVIGPTDDIIAINAAEELLSAGSLVEGQSIGVVSDGSAATLNAIEGLRWFAAQHDLTLRVQSSTVDTTQLRTVPAVFVLASPTVTADLAATLPTSTTLVTTLRGYDPTLISATDAGHVQVALSTPAVGSDFPGAVAITAAITQTGSAPGTMTFAGYATGVTWQRLLTAACDAQALTRAGVQDAMSTIGAASLESVLGASDTALPVDDQQPATRSSAMAVADPTAANGLRPLTGLVVADGIADYAAGLR